MTDDRIKELADEHTIGGRQAYGVYPFAFARAIEAECQKVPDAMGEMPYASEREEGYRDGWNDCREETLAAAPKPEKAEPIAQEPVAWQEVNGFTVVFVPAGTAPWAMDLPKLLYTAPPDQTAEIERMNEAVKYWKAKCHNHFLCISGQDKRIATLEAEIERLNEGWKQADISALEKGLRCKELERQQAVLVEALERVADTDPDDGTAWFHEVANAALASVKGDAVADSRPD
jgi:hypothetical protein